MYTHYNRRHPTPSSAWLSSDTPPHLFYIVPCPLRRIHIGPHELYHTHMSVHVCKYYCLSRHAATNSTLQSDESQKRRRRKRERHVGSAFSLFIFCSFAHTMGTQHHTRRRKPTARFWSRDTRQIKNTVQKNTNITPRRWSRRPVKN